MKYYTDGFLFLSNPSPIGGGYTIIDENNNLISNERVMKKGLTNNEAELLGVYNALKLAEVGDTISTDSQIILGWINNGEYIKKNYPRKESKKARRVDLDPIRIESYDLMISKKIKLIWEEREKNLAGIYNEDAGLDNGLPEL